MVKLSRKWLLAILALGVLLFGGCQYSNDLRNLLITPTPIPATSTPEPLSRESVQTQLAATANAGDVQAEANRQCSFVWDSRPMPVETDLIQAAYNRSGLPQVVVGAQAYGESCIDPETNDVVRFSQMQTDVYLTVPVNNLDDPGEMGVELGRVLDVLFTLPRDTMIGPVTGMIQVRLTSGDGDQNLGFKYDTAQQARSDGISGEELLQLLSKS